MATSPRLVGPQGGVSGNKKPEPATGMDGSWVQVLPAALVAILEELFISTKTGWDSHEESNTATAYPTV